MPKYDNAGDVINLAASEVGITAVQSPLGSTDPSFIQLAKLLTSAGRELLGLHNWQRLTKEEAFTTTAAAEYPLPDDFGYMIDQSHWDRSNSLPMAGPLSAQDWQYLLGSDSAVSSIYVSFRVAEGVLKVLPNPPPSGVDIAYEYVSRNWVVEANGTTFKDLISDDSDIVLYESTLIVKFLKLRFLGAKGFDTTDAVNQFSAAFMQWTGKDISAPVLSMSRRSSFPYLSKRNIPNTGFGS